MGEGQQQGTSEAQELSEKHTLITFVRELADENDAWITPVDAARITGVSESMAHRWVASGRLPIKGNPLTQTPDLVGNPPRTRQVRVSDVAALHPILYPEQSISPAIRTLDMQSIPLEVARITQEQNTITATHQQILHQFSLLEEMVRETTKRLTLESQQQEARFQQTLSTLQEENELRLLETEARFGATQQQLRKALDELQREGQQLAVRSQEALETLRTELTEAQTNHEASVQRTLNSLLTEFRQAWQTYQQTVHERLQQSEQHAIQQLQGVEERSQEQTNKLTGELESLNKHLQGITTVFQEDREAVQARLRALQEQMSDQQRQLVQYEDLERKVILQQEALTQYEAVLPMADLHLLRQLLTEWRTGILVRRPKEGTEGT